MKAKWPLLCGMLWWCGFWFRVCGYGVRICNRRVTPAMFGEREGFLKVYRVGPWSIFPLKP